MIYYSKKASTVKMVCSSSVEADAVDKALFPASRVRGHVADEHTLEFNVRHLPLLLGKLPVWLALHEIEPTFMSAATETPATLRAMADGTLGSLDVLLHDNPHGASAPTLLAAILLLTAFRDRLEKKD